MIEANTRKVKPILVTGPSEIREEPVDLWRNSFLNAAYQGVLLYVP